MTWVKWSNRKKHITQRYVKFLCKQIIAYKMTDTINKLEWYMRQVGYTKIKKEETIMKPLIYNTLESTLFNLSTLVPLNTDKVKYKNIGPYLGKKRLYQFIDEVKKNMGISLDPCVYSRIAIEVSKIDEDDFVEISLDKRCELPIAGNQYLLLERDSEEFGLSFVGFIHSLNMILNDSRIYK